MVLCGFIMVGVETDCNSRKLKRLAHNYACDCRSYIYSEESFVSKQTENEHNRFTTFRNGWHGYK